MLQATVLEEMPPFPERESSILAKLKKKKGPGVVPVSELEDGKREGGELNGGGDRGPDSAMSASNAVSRRCALVQATPKRDPWSLASVRNGLKRRVASFQPIQPEPGGLSSFVLTFFF